MNDQLTYEEYKDQINKYGYRGDYHSQIRMIRRFERFIDDQEIFHFYPKNMFVEDKDTVFYIFTNERLFKVSDKEKKVRVESLNYKDIVSLDIETDDYHGNDRSVLNIKFANGEHVVFDSLQDTNDSWSYAFEDKIIMIFKYLLTK